MKNLTTVKEFKESKKVILEAESNEINNLMLAKIFAVQNLEGKRSKLNMELNKIMFSQVPEDIAKTKKFTSEMKILTKNLEKINKAFELISDIDMDILDEEYSDECWAGDSR